MKVNWNEWKDEIKSTLGLPLLWLFAVGAGYLLNYLDQHYWIWLVLVFIIIPVVVWYIQRRYERKKSSK